MNKQLKKLVYILMINWLLLVATGNSQILKAEKTIDVVGTSRFIPDVCGTASEKTVLVTFGLGNIELKDSLYGYNFEVRYDKTKLRFKNGIYVNTLSEFFDTKDMMFDSDSGMASGYATNMKINLPPVTGNKELFGMTGEYIGECPDTTYVTMKYIDFTEEFKPVIGKYITAVVVPIIADKPERAFKIESMQAGSTMVFGEEEKIDLKIRLGEGSRAESAEIIVEPDKSGLIEIKDAAVLGTNATVDKIEKSGNGIKIKLSLKNDAIDEVLRLTASQLSNSDSSLNININPRTQDSTCLCITRYEGCTQPVSIKYKDTTGTGVNDGGKDGPVVRYDALGEVIEVIDAGAEYDAGEIYDLRGNLIKKIMWNNIDIKKTIPMEGMPAGAYIAVIRSKTKINRSLLIKYL